jgi:hypothetical protein
MMGSPAAGAYTTRTCCVPYKCFAFPKIGKPGINPCNKVLK